MRSLFAAMGSDSFTELAIIPRTEFIYDLEHLSSVSRQMRQEVRLYISQGLARDDVGGYDGIGCMRCGRPVNGLLQVQLGLVHYGCVRKSLPYKQSSNADSIALYGKPRRPRSRNRPSIAFVWGTAFDIEEGATIEEEP